MWSQQDGGRIGAYEEFVRNRITKLREGKGVSECQMSYDLGKSRGYMHNISSGKAMPSLKELFSIIEYFGMSPAEFFDERSQYPSLVSQINRGLGGLAEEDLEALLVVIGRLGKVVLNSTF